ncbi:MAG: hypothetical protein AB7E95_13890 [Kiritimatiellales bacterium]
MTFPEEGLKVSELRGMAPPSVGVRRNTEVIWKTIAMWAAIVLLLDAGFGLWNHERFRQVAPKINILRVALIEAGAAFFLLLLHFLF